MSQKNEMMNHRYLIRVEWWTILDCSSQIYHKSGDES